MHCEFLISHKFKHLTLECVYACWGSALTPLSSDIDRYCSVTALVIRYASTHYVFNLFWKHCSECCESGIWPCHSWTHSCDQTGKNPLIYTGCKLLLFAVKLQFFTVTAVIWFWLGSGPNQSQSAAYCTESHWLWLVIIQFIICRDQCLPNRWPK